jgi:hypothetical protein
MPLHHFSSMLVEQFFLLLKLLFKRYHCRSSSMSNPKMKGMVRLMRDGLPKTLPSVS